MPALSTLTLALAFGGLMLAIPQPGLALDFYVNACCLKTTPVSGGGERRTVSAHVGSSAPHSATVRMTFKVTSTEGWSCQQTVEKADPFVNAATMPVHLRVTYSPDRLKALQQSPMRSTIYTVQAVINNISPPPPPNPPPADVSGNNGHTAKYTLPRGGVAECVTSPGPN
jgi:hypothetical protein